MRILHRKTGQIGEVIKKTPLDYSQSSVIFWHIQWEDCPKIQQVDISFLLDFKTKTPIKFMENLS